MAIQCNLKMRRYEFPRQNEWDDYTLVLLNGMRSHFGRVAGSVNGPFENHFWVSSMEWTIRYRVWTITIRIFNYHWTQSLGWNNLIWWHHVDVDCVELMEGLVLLIEIDANKQLWVLCHWIGMGNTCPILSISMFSKQGLGQPLGTRWLLLLDMIVVTDLILWCWVGRWSKITKILST